MAYRPARYRLLQPEINEPPLHIRPRTGAALAALQRMPVRGNKRLMAEQLRKMRTELRKSRIGKEVRKGSKAVVAAAAAAAAPSERVRERLCERRTTRKAVLLAIGRVNRSGGAPGPYKPQGPKCR